jgi:hypothetical protein
MPVDPGGRGDFERESASLASAKKNASHASWHGQPLRKIQKNKDTVQAGYHSGDDFLGAHSEGVARQFEDQPTWFLVEIALDWQKVHCGTDDFPACGPHGIKC